MHFFDKYSFRAFLGLLIVFCGGLSSCGDSDNEPTRGPVAEKELESSSSEGGVVEFVSCSSSGDFFEEDISSSSEEKEIVFSSSSMEEWVTSSSSSESAPASSDNRALFGDDYFTKDGIDFVKIGDQSWMEKNIKITSGIDRAYLKCYNSKDEMCDKYGTLASWTVFTNTWRWFNGYDGPLLISNPVKGACPNGTHLPTKAELEELMAFLEEHPDEVLKLTNQLGGVYGDGFPDDEKYYDDDGDDVALMGYHGAEDSFVLMGGELSEKADPNSKTLGVWSLHYGKSTGMTLIKMNVGRTAYARCLVNDSTETSGPSRNSSITIWFPLAPNFFSSMISRTAANASSRVIAIRTPFPSARPSALMTAGIGAFSRYAIAFSASSKTAYAAVGIPYFFIRFFAKTLLPSMIAAFFRGPKQGIPMASSSSTHPSTSGSSGATTA